MLKRTALFQEHVRLGGRMVDFGGWELPVQYSGTVEEHRACRNAAGLFDVSHMGEITVIGKSAGAFLDYAMTNQVSSLSIGQAQYTVMCHPDGGIVDDLVIYRRGDHHYLVVVNASNTQKDFQHLEELQSRSSFPDLRIVDESPLFSQIAIQGKNAAPILSRLLNSNEPSLDLIKTYWFRETSLLDLPVILARTGYTGEDGFEIYLEWDKAPELWRKLLEVGSREHGLTACGLGARDTLRLEMKYPLYGHELTDKTHPLEAGLGWIVKMKKEGFVGKEALARAKETGNTRVLVGIKSLDRRIPRQGYPIMDPEGSITLGEVTSGTHSPSLGYPIAIGYVKAGHHEVGSQLTIDIRGSRVPAEIVPTPFYRRNKESR